MDKFEVTIKNKDGSTTIVGDVNHISVMNEMLLLSKLTGKFEIPAENIEWFTCSINFVPQDPLVDELQDLLEEEEKPKTVFSDPEKIENKLVRPADNNFRY